MFRLCVLRLRLKRRLYVKRRLSVLRLRLPPVCSSGVTPVGGSTGGTSPVGASSPTLGGSGCGAGGKDIYLLI